MSLSKTFRSSPPGPVPLTDPTLCFVFKGNTLLVAAKGSNFNIPFRHDLLPLVNLPDPVLCFGSYNGISCCIHEMTETSSWPDSMTFTGLRQLFGAMDDDLFSLAGRAMQICHWVRSNRYCGSCASPMKDKPGEIARVCPDCGFLSYPRLSPAVIMTIEHGHEILLARSSHFPEGMYSTLAGFVEPGETLEEAVHREVSEEVNVKIRNVRYFGSQSWPFPHSLMVGFTSDFSMGEIRIDRSEIEDAGWFTIDTLPRLPSAMSIARALIENFKARVTASPSQRL